MQLKVKQKMFKTVIVEHGFYNPDHCRKDCVILDDQLIRTLINIWVNYEKERKWNFISVFLR